MECGVCLECTRPKIVPLSVSASIRAVYVVCSMHVRGGDRLVECSTTTGDVFRVPFVLFVNIYSILGLYLFIICFFFLLLRFNACNYFIHCAAVWFYILWRISVVNGLLFLNLNSRSESLGVYTYIDTRVDCLSVCLCADCGSMLFRV